MDDKQIIELYRKRDEDAIRRTEQKYANYLFTIAQNVLGSAEDSSECLNDTYFKAWNSIPPHNPPNLAFYLGKITRELAIGRWHKRRAAKRGGSQFALSLDELEECLPAGSSPEQEADAGQLALSIGSYLRGCSAQARSAFIRRYYFCDSIRAIANDGGMSEAKVKSLLFRTRAGLKKYLEKEGFWI